MSGSAIPCAAAEKSSAKYVRVTISFLLLIVCLIECGMASLMVAGQHSVASLMFMLCTLALLAATVISVRDTTGRSLLAAQSAAAAALLALFWASGSQPHAGSTVTIGHSTYELTLTLAGLLFMAMLLARLLRRDRSQQACNCA